MSSAGFYGSAPSDLCADSTRSDYEECYYQQRSRGGNKAPMRRARPLSSSVVAAKTRLCQRFVRGNCTSQNCTFAHGDAELRKKPDLRKTKLCDAFSSNRSCPKGADCTYAHGHHELQSTSEYFKTSICPNWKQGHCQSGDYCRHAHGTQELRSRVTPVSPPAATTETTPSTASSFYDARGLSMDLNCRRSPTSFDSRHSYTPSGGYGKHYADDDSYAARRSNNYRYNSESNPRPLYSPSSRFARKVWPRQPWRPRQWEEYRPKQQPTYAAPPPTRVAPLRKEKSLAPVRELKNTPPVTAAEPDVLTDEDHISSEEPPKQQDPPPPSKRLGQRSSSVHVCAGAYMERRGSEVWNRWQARAASAFYSSSPGSRRQSILCIDLSDTKPAAADAYPLAALVGRHMEGSPNRRAKRSPPPPPREEPPSWPPTDGLLAQGVPVVPSTTPGLTVPGLPVTAEDGDYYYHPSQEEDRRPFIALSPSGPVMIDPVTFRALIQQGGTFTQPFGFATQPFFAKATDTAKEEAAAYT